MIQQGHTNSVLDQSADIEETEFSIEVSESMLRMLTSNVYNDPVLAVVREWSTNACDACIEAGNDVKYTVHLPTTSDPTFFVRDYGTGIHPDKIKSVFSVLGASTKRNSNDFNGTLGIGRMAGLSVANAFTVESFYQGVLYSYAISIRNGKILTLKLGETPTTEPNGLKMSVAVSYDDIYLYEVAANKLYPYFDYKPNINNDNVKLELDKQFAIAEDWFRVKPENGYIRTNHVVMSQVAYAIPENHAIDAKGFTNMVIKVPNGAVTFNPGRESLSLDKQTIDVVNKAFEKMAEEYVDFTHQKMAIAENDAEVMGYYMESRNAPNGVAANIDPSPFVSAELNNLFGNAYTGGRWFSKIMFTEVFGNDTGDKVVVSVKNRHYKSVTRLYSHHMLDWNEFVKANHVIIDVKSKFKAAITKRYDRELLVTWSRTEKTDVADTVKEAKRYLDTIGIPYKLASEILAEIPKEEQTIALREGMYASNLDEHGYVGKSVKMKDEDVTSNTYLYLKLKNTTPQLEDVTKDYREYINAYRLLKDQLGNVPEIKGVPKKYQEIVDDLDNWIDFETYINEQMKAFTYRSNSESMLDWLSIRYRDPNYPTDILNLFKVKEEFLDYMGSANYLNSSELVLAKLFESTKEEFVPSIEVKEDEVLENFPITVELLKSWNLPERINGLYIARIAKLEEYHALHTSKQ